MDFIVGTDLVFIYGSYLGTKDIVGLKLTKL